jgi:uncharacterized membrane protein YGL010W
MHKPWLHLLCTLVAGLDLLEVSLRMMALSTLGFFFVSWILLFVVTGFAFEDEVIAILDGHFLNRGAFW